MSKLRRIMHVIIGLAMIACGVMLLLEPKSALVIVAIVLGLYLVIYGVYTLVYYITMARHMVGGLVLLFIAVLAIDLGSVALAFYEEPRLPIVLYLVCYNVFTGAIAVARAVEARKFESRWKATLAHGILNIALAVACLVFIGSDQIVVAIFCFRLFYGACIRLTSAFKPTEIIYIQ